MRPAGDSRVDLEIALGLARRSESGFHKPPARLPEAPSKGRIGGQLLDASREIGLRAEEEPGHAVLHQRAVAGNVGSEHGASEGERLEHRIGHAAFGQRTVEDDIDGLEERGHGGVRYRPQVARPWTTAERLLQALGLPRIEGRSRVPEPQPRMPMQEAIERSQG